MHELMRLGQTLPAIPMGWPHPLEGENVVHQDLIPHVRGDSAEHAIARFRTEHNPAQQPYFRRYYLRRRKTNARNGQPTYSLFYV